MEAELVTTPVSRRTVKRSMTMRGQRSDAGPSTSSPAFPPLSASLYQPGRENEEDLSILRLDLNLGAARQTKSLMRGLERSSIAALLDTRLTAALEHIDLLKTRIFDAQSRVLVTGDLNAGKSTLVNALLRRSEIMPTDEQPLTTRFVEVVSAKENNGVEEIHVLDSEKKYDILDRETYSVESLEKLQDMVADLDTDASSPSLRVYLKEADETKVAKSILHNGVVDISLIDAPGLNRDSIKTTANFARQEEIDVVVFVVSAANHFTLSAKEFIWQAGHEKAHLFIVVNRFDQIRDKERCRRMVLEQIRQLSPRTYEDAADLVHFVDSAKTAYGFAEDEPAEEIDAAFCHLEHSLRSFVLVNRSKSKLGPAHNYLTHLLADVELLATANGLVATKERDDAQAEQDRVKPELASLKGNYLHLEESLMATEDQHSARAEKLSKQAIADGLERIGRGELAVNQAGLVLPSYPGLLGVWDYVSEVRRAMVASIDVAISLIEQEAREIAGKGVQVINEIGDKNLPADVPRSNRQFNPQAMFSARHARKTGSMGTAGLRLGKSPQLTQAGLNDVLVFDLQQFFSQTKFALPSSTSSSSSALIPYSSELSGFTAASLAFGAWSMLNNRTPGIHSLVDSTVSLLEMASNPAVRKWAGPIAGVITFGAVAYVVSELPRSVPRNVGRSLQATLSVSSGMPGGSDGEDVSLAEAVSARIAGEVKKVLRLGANEWARQYSGAVSSREEVVRQNQAVIQNSEKAITRFAAIEHKAQMIKEDIADVKI